MRCFIAINLNDPIKKEIDRTVTEFKQKVCDVKWVSAENLHATLKFLGETSDDLVQTINRGLAEIAVRHEPFSLTLRGLGLFPDSRRPRVVWVGIIDSSGLRKLYEAVEDLTSTLGYKDEKRGFSPHITIGRVRSQRGQENLVSHIETLRNRDFGNIEVSSISLMKSDLSPAGAQYSTIAEIPLLRRKNDQ